MLGLTIKRPEVAKEDEGTFKSLRPELPLSEDQLRLGHVNPPEINREPALPVALQTIERAKNTGNNKLAELLAKAEVSAKEQAKIIEHAHRVSTNNAPRKQKEEKTITKIESAPQVLFTDADKCDDVTFIKRAMGTDIHQPDMKRLFYANGGQAYIDAGLLYAPAFDTLRRAKATAIRVKQGTLKIDKDEPEWKRFGSVPKDSKVYIAGLPTIEILLARENAERDAKERSRTEAWLANQ